MRSFIFCILLFTMYSLSSIAQEIPNNAIGLRLGDTNGFGTEISYQRKWKEDKRLEFNLGLRSGTRFNAWRATGLYQWVYNLYDQKLLWFIGAGPSVGKFSFDQNYIGDTGQTLFFQAVGDIGIEYHFNFPLQLAIDFRPELAVINSVDNFIEYDLALSARYRF